MQSFEWVDAHSVAEAAASEPTTVAAAMVASASGATSDAAVLKAGGIDLLDLMKEGLLQPHRIVNLRNVADLNGVRLETDGRVRIGAMATIAQVAEHPAINRNYAALAQATRSSATPQIRNVATLGGNLLQRPRCWYFRSAQHHCTRKGGQVCYAFGGENQYHAIFDHTHCAIVHPSTAATALVALGASVELVNREGKRREIELEQFYVLPSHDVHRENVLDPGEILTAVLLPKAGAGTASAHLKQGEKDSFDWPVADVAVVLDRNQKGVCRRASIVLGAAAPVPHRAVVAENLLRNMPVTEAAAREAGRVALTGALPLSKNAYKLPIFETLVRRAILAAASA